MRVSSAVMPPAALPTHEQMTRLVAVGDRGLLVELGQKIDAETQERVLRLDAALTAEPIAGVDEVIVGYASLLIVFDPVSVDYDALVTTVKGLMRKPRTVRRSGRCWRVPVCYSRSFGIDLDMVAGHCGIGVQELVAAHSDARYTIAMFGFLPGFAYLSGLPAHLAIPRRSSPRRSVPGGSIAIGGAQTAIGSIEGPCGWHVIGRTPIRTFDAARYPATVFEPGDEILFERIDEAQFCELDGRALRGEMLAEKVA